MATPAPSQTPRPLGSVLVTGGCGFLGSHIVSLLLMRYPSASTRISVLDLHTTSEPQPGVIYHAADLCDASAVAAVLDAARPSVVIHTASPVLAAHSPRYRERLWRINVAGTRDLLRACRARGVKAFVHTSSASVVSDTRTDLVNADERYTVVRGALQREYYSDTKAEAEQIVLAANTRDRVGLAGDGNEDDGAASAPFLTCAIRPSAIFGERDVQMIPNMLAVLRAGRTRFQLGANDNLFDFTYVGNTAHAHLLAAAALLDAHARLSSSPLPHQHRRHTASAAGAAVETTTAAASAAAASAAAISAAAAAAASAASANDDNDDDDDTTTPDRRVDGEAFIITNASPVYFWDFARAVWQKYSDATCPPTSRASSAASFPPPAAPSQVTRLPRTAALLVAALMWWAWTLLRLRGEPSLTTTRVTYACMTRYFSSQKAERRLGYRPLWTLDEGVDRTVVWFAAQSAHGMQSAQRVKEEASLADGRGRVQEKDG